jgi:hypothetical protein
MKVIIFVHTCEKYEECRAKIIENTWGKDKNVVFITDNKKSSLKNYIYIGPYKQGPTYHPENVIKMFNLFLKNYSDYDFFMIIDDDSYLYIDKLKLYLSFFDKNDNYMIGDFLNWIAPRNEPYFTCDYNKWISGGPGIVLTKKCIETFLYLITQHNIPYTNHDVWLHRLFMVSDKRIKRVDCPGFHQYNSKVLLQKYSKEDNNIISVHLERNLDLINDYHINTHVS